MKLKLIDVVNSVILLLLTSPLMAQQDPGEDPNATPAPIDHYVWVLALVGLVFVFIKFKAIQSKRLNR